MRSPAATSLRGGTPMPFSTSCAGRCCGISCGTGGTGRDPHREAAELGPGRADPAASRWRWRRSWPVVAAAVVLVGVVYAVFWPLSDLIARHDVGAITGRLGFRPGSCRDWYQADRHPGAWHCTTTGAASARPT